MLEVEGYDLPDTGRDINVVGHSRTNFLQMRKSLRENQAELSEVSL